MRVLIVCTGNTCRSPMAAAILEDLGRGADLEVRSAGVGTVEGLPAAAEAVTVAGGRGLSLAGHRSRPLDPELLEWADHVLVMERRHKRMVERLGAAEKVTLLSEYGGDAGDILDPLGLGEDVYEEVFNKLEKYLAAFLATERRPKPV